MKTFQALGASLDAAAQNVSAALACSTIVDPAGFSVQLNFASPPSVAPGKSPNGHSHVGMQPLMAKMAEIIRRRPMDYESLMAEAIDEMGSQVSIDADAFTASLNAVRQLKGMSALIPEDADAQEVVADRVANELNAARAQWADGEEERIQARVRIALEAREAELAHDRGEPSVSAESEAPPPPRGAGARKAR